MKNKLFTFFIFFPTITFSQNAHRFLSEFFLGRQPNAAAEAMGRGYVSLDGDLGSITFNPAGIAKIEKSEILTSYSPPGYILTKGFYTFAAGSYRVKSYLNVAVSHFRFNSGNTPSNLDGKIYREKYTLTISSEPVKNLLLGLNANQFLWREGAGSSAKPFFFDFGFIKKFPIGEEERHQNINIGASISNFTKATTTSISSGYISKWDLPVITKYGISYKSEYGSQSIIDSGSIIKLLFQTEYQMLLNSKYLSAIKFGTQITILDLLSLRAGYYEEKEDNYNFPDFNKSQIEAFTYGAGIQIPLNSFTKIPVRIFFDYIKLPQVNYTYYPYNIPNFSTYTLRLNYEVK